MLPIVLTIVLACSSVRGVAIDQGQDQVRDGEHARNYNERYSAAYDEPYDIEFKYHNHDEMSRFLRTTAHRYANLTALYSIGKSVKGMKSINFRTKNKHF